MNWTEENEANNSISYNHVICDTPIGQIIIEWKGWKERPDYSIDIDNKYIGTEYTLDNAKLIAKDYLNNKLNELSIFLK